MLVSRPTSAAEDVLRANSRSFDLASRVLGEGDRRSVAVLYAWCRRVDDTIDLSHGAEQVSGLARLRREIDAVYAGSVQADPLLRELQRVMFERGVPSEYPRALLDGMAMDVAQVRYASLADLHCYCWRVAGVVGIMLCHLLGISDAAARRPAAQLGMAMQLTNVCRDVLEDWQRGRLYLPEEILVSAGIQELGSRLGRPLAAATREPLAGAVEQVLRAADQLYQLADAGMSYLPFRAGLAVRVARRLYSDIGTTLRASGCDVFAERAVVPPLRKVRLVLEAVAASLLDLPTALRFKPAALPGHLAFPHDVLG
jgi:15-cis-phytoene synthase